MYKLALDLYWHCMCCHKLWKKLVKQQVLYACVHAVLLWLSFLLSVCPVEYMSCVKLIYTNVIFACLRVLTQLPVMQFHFRVITCISGTRFLAFLTIALAASCYLKESWSDFTAATSLIINCLHFLSTLEQASCSSPVNMALFAPGDVPLPHPVVQ